MKPKTLFLGLALLSLCSVELKAQMEAQAFSKREKEKSIFLFGGFHTNKSQDLVISPMIYDGTTGNALGLQYESRGHKGIHQIRLAFDQTDVSGTPLIDWEAFEGTRTRLPSEALQINISYGYAQRLNNSDRFKLYLGGLLEAKIHHTTYHMGLSEEEGYVLANTLNTWLRADYQLQERSSLEASLVLPLVAWVSRPDYAIVDNEEIQNDGSDLGYVYGKGQLASWGAYQAVGTSLAYSYDLSRSVGIQVRYQMEYFRYEKPLLTAVLRHWWDVGVGVKF